MGDIIILVIAIWLGLFLNDYECSNPCPLYCKIDHNHRLGENNDKEKESKD